MNGGHSRRTGGVEPIIHQQNNYSQIWGRTSLSSVLPSSVDNMEISGPGLSQLKITMVREMKMLSILMPSIFSQKKDVIPSLTETQKCNYLKGDYLVALTRGGMPAVNAKLNLTLTPQWCYIIAISKTSTICHRVLHFSNCFPKISHPLSRCFMIFFNYRYLPS